MNPTYAWIAIVVLAIATALGWGGYLNEIYSTEDSGQVTSEISSSPSDVQESTETTANIGELTAQNKSLVAANESLVAENQALKNLNESLSDAAETTTNVGELVDQNKSLVAVNESLTAENQTLQSQNEGLLAISNITEEVFVELLAMVEQKSTAIKQTASQPLSKEQVTGSSNTAMTESAADAAGDSESSGADEAPQSTPTSSMASKFSEALVAENQKYRAARDELEAVKSQLMESEERRTVLEVKLSLLDEQNRQVVQSLGTVLDEHEVVSEQASAAPVLEDIARQLTELGDESTVTASEPEEVGNRVTEVIDRLEHLSQEKDSLEEQLSVTQIQLARSEQRNDYLAKRLQYASKHLRRIRFGIRSEKERNEGLAEALNTVQNKLSEEVTQLETEITSLKTGISGIRLGTDILFASGSADLTADGQNALRIFNQELEKYSDAIISVEGHTDTVPIKSTIADKYPTNWELSSARASSAVRYLVKLGVSEERIRAIGHGQSRPADTNDTEQGRSRNRRIELVVHLRPNSNN